MKTSASLVLFLFFSFSVFAQKEANIWYFGYNSGLDFSNGSPVSISDGEAYGCGLSYASISDNRGRLLFYADGCHIYNRKHLIMENLLPFPDSLLGTLGLGNMFIVPHPGNKNQYYLFIAAMGYHCVYNCTLEFYLIDMSLDLGMGGIVEHHTVVSNVSEKATAIPHSNGKDFWIISYSLLEGKYFSFLLSPTGLNTIPIVSQAAVFPKDSCDFQDTDYIQVNMGTMKASPQGNKLSMSLAYAGMVELAEFNKCTGGFSNFIQIPIGKGVYGIEFSPDGSKLYATIIGENPTTTIKSRLYQININAGSVDDIMASIYDLGNQDHFWWGLMQLGPDKKIYISRFDLTTNDWQRLSVIQDPDLPGLGCNIKYDGIFVGGNSWWIGMSYFIASQVAPPVFELNTMCYQDSVLFILKDTSRVQSIEWDFDDPASGLFNHSYTLTSTHKFSAPGDYNVSVTILKQGALCSETFYRNIPIDSFPVLSLSTDTVLCENKELLLDLPVDSLKYNWIWSNGSIQTGIKVSQPDTAWLEISNACGSVRDSIIVNFQEPPQVKLGNDTTLCYDMFPVNLDASISGVSYKWQDGSVAPIYHVVHQDTLWVDVSEGVCTVRDSIIFLSTAPAPVVDLGRDTLLCEHSILYLNVFNNGAFYKWQDGSTLSDYYVSIPDTVSVEVRQGACIRRDTIIVDFKPLPIVDLGRDTILCNGESLLLNAFQSGGSYLWQDGTFQPDITILQPDTVWVDVTMNDCKTRDSVIVNFIDVPSINLGQDTVLCEGQALSLSAHADSASYIWNDGSILSTKSITVADTAWVQVANKCGNDKDSIIVRFITEPVISLGKDTVLCYHDSLLITLPDSYNYTWNDSDKENEYVITSSGLYTVEAKNKCGTATASKKVETISCCDPVVPNLLTPNKDGLNEILEISCIEDKGWKLEVSNRWGEIVYTDTNYENDLNASQLKEGIYFYSLSKEGRKEGKGWIQVVK